MSYLLIIGTVLLGLFSLHKDWHNYKHPWIRRAVGAVLLLVGALSVIKYYRDNQVAQITRTKAAHDINTLRTELAGLQGQARAANEAQTQNTKVFLDTLNRLSDKVRDLQTQVTTEELRKQLASVQDDLQKTQKAMAPAPKAALTFSFFPFTNPQVGSKGRPSAVTETSLPLAPNGSVHVEFSILNLTDVSALDGEITLIICANCKFAKEPTGFRRIPNESDEERYLAFDRMLPWVSAQFAVDIILPFDAVPTVQTFDIGMAFRCRTCILETNNSKGTVHLLR